MRKIIKCGKDFLSLGLLIPEMELDWLPGKNSIAIMPKRDKVTQRCQTYIKLNSLDILYSMKNLPQGGRLEEIPQGKISCI